MFALAADDVSVAGQPGIGNTSTLELTDGTFLDLAGHKETDRRPDGNWTRCNSHGTVMNSGGAAAALTVGGGNVNSTFDGKTLNAFDLMKTGSGTLILSTRASINHTGTTTSRRIPST